MDGLEALAILLGLVAVFSVLAVPFLLISHLGLKAKVRDLEALVMRGARAPEARPQTTAPRPASAATETPAQTQEPLQPWAPKPAAVVPEPQPEPEPETPAAFVFKADLVDKLSAWLRENWVLAIAAASLALAGVFMVQYGIENGLITPFWRVMGALAFGAALIGGGEYIRRKGGDEVEDGDAVGATRHLPSTLSGAGIIVLYVAVFSARALYDLIGPLTTLIGLAGVSVVSLVLGWFSGPVLAAVGILGATLAPFVVGSSSNNSWMVHYYLALIALTALGVDTIKRWAWISALGLLATLGGNAVLYAAKGADLHFLAATLIIAFGAFTIPERGLIPRQSGASLLDAIWSRGKLRPEFPTRLTLGTTFAATLAAVLVMQDATTPDTVWLAILALTLLLAATVVWARQAPALYDHALIPGIAILLLLAFESLGYGPLYRAFQNAALPVTDGPAPALPMTIWVLSGLGALGSVLMFARMNWALQGEPSAPLAPAYWALCSTIFAPATLLILEFMWGPGAVLGDYPWALAAIAMAALMVLLATRAATATDDGRALRTGLFAVGALTLITLAVFLVLTKAALTVALSVMVLGTAYLDRRTPLPPLTWFIQIAVAIITFRLVVWPGLPWALDIGWNGPANLVPYPEVAFAFLATLALLGAAWWLSRGQRLKTALVLESACWTIFGIFLAVSMIRAVGQSDVDTHWMMGLLSTIWVALALNQLYRMQGGGRFSTVLRGLLTALYTLTALGTMIALFTALSPFAYGGLVVGPPVFDSLLLAYLPLAAVFAVGAWKIRHFGRLPRLGFTVVAAFLGAMYIGTEIRRLWRGRDLSVPGFSDPELYNYTIAMLIASVALLVFAFARRSDILRKIAMAGVALTVAKVFLVDMSGLSGLIRVMSFMGLGLSLVALAWLNRKMTAQWDRGEAGGSGRSGHPPVNPPQ
ncbi:DUF2339 domain-containing protein [Pseudorhodobacter sp. E13]|uniref:DUF2339 domain-containing protein n=1 Tax=Pseudorhodobacter sp. E13 TaxID=2487931 RepID=UPI000F8DAD44|nr:DUF2339 domain-containing protein [Pseudorhodobacter sp. E13]RUS59031.1 DUF2339 domain-containing protein [Pseudorhodobacter sp. E13]